MPCADARILVVREPVGAGDGHAEPVALDRELGDLDRVVGADGRRVHEREVREVEEVVEHQTGTDARAGGDELVVQEPVGVGVREVETLTDRFVGREEDQAADLGEPGG